MSLLILDEAKLVKLPLWWSNFKTLKKKNKTFFKMTNKSCGVYVIFHQKAQI